MPFIVLAALILAGFGLWGRLPDPRAFVHALVRADYRWVVAAVALQFFSLAAFAWQQHHLMNAFGVRLRTGHVALVTLGRTALSISLPAGGAVSAGWAVREYERVGCTRDAGAASMIVSGLTSIGGLTLLYVAGGTALVTRDPALLLSPRPLAVVAGLFLVAAVAVLAGRRRLRRPASAASPVPDGRVVGLIRRTLRTAQDGWHAGAALRAWDWTASTLLLAANWLADLLCLVATCRAVGLPVGMATLAGIYLGVQIVRQVPLTPGGVGVVDTALVAGLTAVGATAVGSAAAVLLYRVISCWLLLPTGGIAILALRRRAQASPSPARAVS